MTDTNRGPVMGEHGAFESDASVPDQSADIMDIFGLSADLGEAPASANADGGEGGGMAPAPPAHSAAEGEPGQHPPTTPAPPQTPSPPAVAPPSPPQAQPPAPPQGGAATPGAAQPDPAAELQTLRAQVDALTRQLTAQPPQSPQGGGQPANTGQPSQPQELEPEIQQLRDYRLAIPDDVATAIFSDDPAVARQGMSHLVNSLGKIVHERVIKEADRLVEQRLTNYGATQQHAQQQAEMQRDYFTHFKDHEDPAIRLIVAQQAQAMWTEQPTLPWNEASRNALGARVNALLGRSAAQPPAPGAAPPPPAPPAPAPAPQMGGSTRPPGSSNGGDQGNEISNILASL